MRIKTGLACLASVASAAGVSGTRSIRGTGASMRCELVAVRRPRSCRRTIPARPGPARCRRAPSTTPTALPSTMSLSTERAQSDAAGRRPGRGDEDVHQEREHDADRLLGADPAAGHRQQPRRHQLRHRLQGQPRLPGPLERLPGHRHLQPDEPDADLQHRGLPAHVRPGRRRRARQHPGPHVGFGQQRPAQREPDLHGPVDRSRLRGHPHLGHLEPRGPRLRPPAADGGDRQRRGRPGRGLRRAHGDRRAGRRARLLLPVRRRLQRHLQRHRHRPHQALGPDGREVPEPCRRTGARRPATTTTC